MRTRTLAKCCGNCEHFKEYPITQGRRLTCSKNLDNIIDVGSLEVCKNFSWGD